MKFLSSILKQKESLQDSQIISLNMMIEDVMEFLPESPKIRPLEDLIDLPFLSLDEIEPLNIDERQMGVKNNQEGKSKLMRKRIVKKPRTRKGSENGVLD